MAFGNKSKPTRKYNYGCRGFLSGPREINPDGTKALRQRFDGHDLAVTQMKLAHQFQNKLVEIERARREAIDPILVRHFPALTTLHNAAQEQQERLQELRDELSQSNSQNRQLMSDPELVEQINAQKRVVSQAWEFYSDQRDAAFADPKVKADLKDNDKSFEQRKADARNAAVEGGLYWATSLQVVGRVKRTGPPPKFKSWRGEEVISVQFQRKPDKTSPKEPVLDSKGNPKIHPRSKKPTFAHVGGSSLRTCDVFTPNTNCWIERTYQPPLTAPHPKYVVIHFRVSSDEKGKPVMASIPAVMSRPLPEDGEVKWVHLSRRKIGTHYRWDVQFDIARDAWTYHPAGQDRAQEGTVAVALGWRLIDGEIRVTEWVGDDGVTGTVRIPKELVEGWSYLDTLQSIRDTLFEAERAELVDWFVNYPNPLPEEWTERAQTLIQWRSADRFMWLIWWWKDHRIPGDEEIFQRMWGRIQLNPTTGRNQYTGGRLQSKHLCDWRAHKRDKIKNWRKDFFRKVAIDLSYQYKDVVIAEIDWNKLAENPEVENGNDIVNKRYRALSSCAQLRDEITRYMNEVTESARNIVTTCCQCGESCDHPKSGRWIRCESCGGEKRDRAVNAATNLLNRALGASGAKVPARV